MGQLSNKFQISNEGKIYQFNEDGSFTECVVVEKSSAPNSSSNKYPTKRVIGYILLIFGILGYIYYICIIIFPFLHIVISSLLIISGIILLIKFKGK